MFHPFELSAPSVARLELFFATGRTQAWACSHKNDGRVYVMKRRRSNETFQFAHTNPSCAHYAKKSPCWPSRVARCPRVAARSASRQKTGTLSLISICSQPNSSSSASSNGVPKATSAVTSNSSTEMRLKVRDAPSASSAKMTPVKSPKHPCLSFRCSA